MLRETEARCLKGIKAVQAVRGCKPALSSLRPSRTPLLTRVPPYTKSSRSSRELKGRAQIFFPGLADFSGIDPSGEQQALKHCAVTRPCKQQMRNRQSRTFYMGMLPMTTIKTTSAPLASSQKGEKIFHKTDYFLPCTTLL